MKFGPIVALSLLGLVLPVFGQNGDPGRPEIVYHGDKPRDQNTVRSTGVKVTSNQSKTFRKESQWICTDYHDEPELEFGKLHKYCKEYGENDGLYAKKVGFYENQAAANNQDPFLSSSFGNYEGCGPSAIKNILGYFNVYHLNERDIRSQIKTYKVNDYTPGAIGGNSIATLPVDLASGLEKLLNRHAYGEFDVHRISGTTQSGIRSELSKGNLVVALVEDGTHWVVVNSFRSSNTSTVDGRLDAYSYHIIDYGGRDRWVGSRDVSLIFGSGARWGELASKITSQGKYLSGTILSVRQTSSCREGAARSAVCPSTRPIGNVTQECSNGRWITKSTNCRPRRTFDP